MIIHVAEIAQKVLNKKDIFIATDNNAIEEEVLRHNFNCIRTENALTGTDRVYLASKNLDYKFIINIQGDEPLLLSKDIVNCINLKINNPDLIFNGFSYLEEKNDALSLNIPKLVTDNNDTLLYISRNMIPFYKINGGQQKIKYKKQVCIYGFTKRELALFYNYGKKSYLENIEDIEILRFLELGMKVKMFKCDSRSIAVDVPSDVIKVEEALTKRDEIL